MERIHYAGDSILTGTEISTALFEYAAALARREDSIPMEVPTRAADGSTTITRLLLGPASQLASEPEESEYDELIDEGFVARVRESTALLGAARAGAIDDDPFPPTELDV